MKKNTIIVLILLLIAILGIGVYLTLNSKNKQNNLEKDNSSNSAIKEEAISKDNQDDNTEKENNTGSSSKKILVVYYSAQSHTEKVAKKIANNLNADLFEIEPKETYTSDDLNWSNEKSRVSKEHDDESLRNVELKTTKVDKWSDYDTVLIGYPIWWGIAAWPVNSFVKANDFKGKTVIPFCTSASSGIGNSGKLLEKDAGSGKWLTGQRFSSNPSDNDIKSFTDNLNK